MDVGLPAVLPIQEGPQKQAKRQKACTIERFGDARRRTLTYLPPAALPPFLFGPRFTGESAKILFWHIGIEHATSQRGIRYRVE